MPLQRRLPKRGFKSQSLKYNGEVTSPTCSAWRRTKSTCMLKKAGLVGELIKHVKVIKSRRTLAQGQCSRASARPRVPRLPSKPLAAFWPDRFSGLQGLRRGNFGNPAGQERKVRRPASPAVFLLLALVVYRIGAHIPVPGIDPSSCRQLFKGQQGGILNLFNMFSGGALSRFTVFALGIMPYISASIIMQLMSYVVPTLEALKKEGEAGRRKITQYTRYGTLGWLVPVAGHRPGAGGLGRPGDRPGFGLPHDRGRQPGGRHDVPDVAGRADHRARSGQRHLDPDLRRYCGGLPSAMGGF
jgi:hypothetical protein